MHDGPLQSGDRRRESEIEKTNQRFVHALAAHDRNGHSSRQLTRRSFPRYGSESLAGFLLNSWEGALLRSQAEKSDAPLEIFLRYAFDALAAEARHRKLTASGADQERKHHQIPSCTTKLNAKGEMQCPPSIFTRQPT